ncbi:hypothetical protein [Pseudaquabacterium rugosum]|uniref:Uncharacterized protein n=1 Tax=Pseudaquabacterium rugosum TaxID=2984194 RepID=A0ABU9BA31_9BURK
MGNQEVLNRLVQLYEDLFSHDGYGEIRVDIRLLRKGQKEVILHCGKQHRFVVDAQDAPVGARHSRFRVIEQQAGDRRRATERRTSSLPIDFADRREPGHRRS